VTLRAALTADWPLKLTSLALSVLLWLVASSEEPANGLLDVELRVQPPAGRVVLRDPGPIRATVVGRRGDLLRLARDNLVLTRILPDSVTADSVSLAINPADLVFPGNSSVRVQDVEPRRVAVELDPITQRTVPVRPVVRLQSQAGFELVGGVAVLPGEVRIAGPADRVSAIDSAVTVPVELTRANGPTELHVIVDTSGFGPVRVFPLRVTLSLNVQAMGERTLWPVVVQLPSTLHLQPDRDTLAVRVRGPRARLVLLTPDSVAVTVGPIGSGPAPHRAALRVLLPAGLSGTAVPDSVTLTRRVDRG
jgi:hypothetical protein